MSGVNLPEEGIWGSEVGGRKSGVGSRELEVGSWVLMQMINGFMSLECSDLDRHSYFRQNLQT